MACNIKIHPDNSIKFSLSLRNPDASPKYVNDATVTATVTTLNDENVEGQSWPLALGYVSGSNGKYQETIAPVSGIEDGCKYKVKFDATGTGGLIGHWEQEIYVVPRIR